MNITVVNGHDRMCAQVTPAIDHVRVRANLPTNKVSMPVVCVLVNITSRINLRCTCVAVGPHMLFLQVLQLSDIFSKEKSVTAGWGVLDEARFQTPQGFVSHHLVHWLPLRHCDFRCPPACGHSRGRRAQVVADLIRPGLFGLWWGTWCAAPGGAN